MSNLTRLSDHIEFDLDLEGFGQDPVLLGHILDDPLHIGLGGGLLGLVALTLPGAGWIIALAICFVTGNDIFWAFSEPDDDEFEGETVEAEASPVDELSAVDELKQVQPDNWVDSAIESGDYQPSWPPPTPAEVNNQLNTMAYNEARDLVMEGPAALLDLLGDQTPGWVRTAAAGHTSLHAHETLSVTGGDTPSVTAVTGKSDRKVTASDSLSNGFGDSSVFNSGHLQSQQAGDRAHEASVTASDMSLNAYVNGLSLAEFKKQFCQDGGGLDASDLNAEPGRQAAISYVKTFVDHYGFTPVEFCVWWGWGVTKKGGTSPSAQKYAFVAEFVSGVFRENQSK